MGAAKKSKGGAKKGKTGAVQQKANVAKAAAAAAAAAADGSRSLSAQLSTICSDAQQDSEQLELLAECMKDSNNITAIVVKLRDKRGLDDKLRKSAADLATRLDVISESELLGSAEFAESLFLFNQAALACANRVAYKEKHNKILEMQLQTQTLISKRGEALTALSKENREMRSEMAALRKQATAATSERASLRAAMAKLSTVPVMASDVEPTSKLAKELRKETGKIFNMLGFLPGGGNDRTATALQQLAAAVATLEFKTTDAVLKVDDVATVRKSLSSRRNGIARDIGKELYDGFATIDGKPSEAHDEVVHARMAQRYSNLNDVGGTSSKNPIDIGGDDPSARAMLGRAEYLMKKALLDADMLAYFTPFVSDGGCKVSGADLQAGGASELLAVLFAVAVRRTPGVAGEELCETNRGLFVVVLSSVFMFMYPGMDGNTLRSSKCFFQQRMPIKFAAYLSLKKNSSDKYRDGFTFNNRLEALLEMCALMLDGAQKKRDLIAEWYSSWTSMRAAMSVSEYVPVVPDTPKQQPQVKMEVDSTGSAGSSKGGVVLNAVVTGAF